MFSEYYTEDMTGAQIDAAESIKRLASYSGRLAVLGLQVCQLLGNMCIHLSLHVHMTLTCIPVLPLPIPPYTLGQQ